MLDDCEVPFPPTLDRAPELTEVTGPVTVPAVARSWSPLCCQDPLPEELLAPSFLLTPCLPAPGWPAVTSEPQILIGNGESEQTPQPPQV